MKKISKKISKTQLRKIIFSAEFRYFAGFNWTQQNNEEEEIDAIEQHGINFLNWLSHRAGGCTSAEKPKFNHRLMERVGSAWARSRGWGYNNPVPSPAPRDIIRDDIPDNVIMSLFEFE